MKASAWITVVVALLCSSFVSKAATPQASAAVLNLSFQLFDLDPNDGITPSITFANGIEWSMRPRLYNTFTGSILEDTRHGLLDGTPDSIALNTGASGASAALGGNPIGSSSSLLTEMEAGNYVLATSEIRLYGRFSISPMTLVVMSNRVTLRANTNGGSDSAGMAYSLEGVLDDGQGASSGSLLFPSCCLDWSQSQSLLFDEIMKIEVFNSTPALQTGSFSGYIGGSVSNNPYYPVPEPETWLLMAGGLVCLVVVARRR